jgi:hypothetical protein
LLAVLAVCVTIIVLFRGHRKALTTADRTQINELRERVRVLEQIVTDGGLNTAAQIEALREQPKDRLERGE